MAIFHSFLRVYQRLAMKIDHENIPLTTEFSAQKRLVNLVPDGFVWK